MSIHNIVVEMLFRPIIAKRQFYNICLANCLSTVAVMLH